MAFRFCLLLLPIFLLSCGSGSGENADKKDSAYVPPVKIDSFRPGLVYASQMGLVKKSAYDDYRVRIGDSIYTCNYKGVITNSDTSGSAERFITDLKAEYLIDEVFLQPIEGNRYFVAWQETDHIGVSSNFALFARGNSVPLWKKKVKAPTPGQPVIDSGSVYISSLGMIAKVNLYSGDEFWKYDSLFNQMKLAYKEFEPALIYTSSVCFYDKPIKGKKTKRDSIWINDKSGKLVR